MLNDQRRVYRETVGRHRDATQRHATRRHAALYCARRYALIRDYTSIVSVVCARYSTRELGIIFVKPLSAADRAFVAPQ